MPVMQTLSDQRVPVQIWTNDIDDKAKQQLSNVASLPFIHHHVTPTFTMRQKITPQVDHERSIDEKTAG